MRQQNILLQDYIKYLLFDLLELLLLFAFPILLLDISMDALYDEYLTKWIKFMSL